MAYVFKMVQRWIYFIVFKMDSINLMSLLEQSKHSVFGYIFDFNYPIRINISVSMSKKKKKKKK